MATKTSKAVARDKAKLELVLDGLAKKLARCRALRKGLIVVRTVGRDRADYCLDCSEGHVRVLKHTAPAAPPAIEIIGDPLQVKGVLAGTKDARKHFLAGGFRIRGNLQYASDLGLELGVLKEPIRRRRTP